MGGLDEYGVVEGDEGLQRGVGAVPADDADFPVGRVKGGHGGVGAGAAPGGVDAASVLVLALTGFPVDLSTEGSFEPQVGLGWVDRVAIHLRAKQATNGECLVTHHLGREAHTRATGEQAVGRVHGVQLGGDVAVLLVGCRCDDELEEFFHVPAGLTELNGEPVE